MSFEKITLAGGRAVLYRGDSLALLAAGLLKYDAIVSDPPYGIGFQHSGGGNGLRLKSGEKVPRDTRKIIGDDAPFDPSPWVGHAGDKPIVLFGADHFKTRLPEGGCFIAWDKSVGGGGANLFSDAEFAWTNRRNARCIYRQFWMGAIRAGEGSSAKQKRMHVSQKPVELMAWCIEHARIMVGKTVLDPYMGSGSTGIACLQTGRRFIGVEIDSGHFDVARQRIEDWWAKNGAPSD